VHHSIPISLLAQRDFTFGLSGNRTAKDYSASSFITQATLLPNYAVWFAFQYAIYTLWSSVNINVRLSLSRPWSHLEGTNITPRMLNLVARWRWVINITYRNPGTCWTGSWASPRVGLDALEKRVILLPISGFEPRTLQPLAVPASGLQIVWVSE